MSNARPIRRIALIAHDNKKPLMIDWVHRHRDQLAKYELSATGTTGMLVEKQTGLPVLKYKSGPLGGDQQIGGKIAEGEIDMLIFFWDPMAPHPHDPDVKALLRIAAVYDLPVACTPSSANIMAKCL
jgi:methylglyoxal synthase